MLKTLFFKLSVVLATLLILIVIAILVLPSALRWGGEKWLRDQGLQASIEAVELDLSQGRLVVRGMRGKAPEGGGFELGQLRVTWRWSPLWDKELRIAGIEVNGLQLDASHAADGAWHVAGLAIPAADNRVAAPQAESNAEPSPWRYRLGNVSITNLRVCYRDRPLSQQSDPLQSGFADVCTRWDDLNWRGETLLGPQPADRSQPLPWEVTGSLLWKGLVMATQDGAQTRVAFDELAVNRLHLQGGDTGDAERITLAGLHLADPLHAAHLPDWFTLDGLTLEGVALVQGESLQLRAAQVHNAVVRQTQGAQSGQPMAGIDALKLAQLRIDGLGTERNLTLQQVSATGITALKRQAPADKTPPYIATLKSVAVEGLAMPTPSTLRIDKLHLETPMLWLARNAAGRWELVDWLAVPTPQEAPVDKGSRSPLQLLIGELRIDGNGAVTLDDQKVSPPFRDTVDNIALTMGSIDNSAPAQASPLKIEAGIGEYGKLTLTGEIKPFAPRPDLKLSGTLSGVDLAPATSYARDALQQNIRQGSLDADLKITINDGQLDSTVDLALQKLELSPMSKKELAGAAEQELGVPLNAALSLLRDKDNAIRLNLPIAGDVNSPDVSVRNVLGKVMGKAIKSAIVAYYSPFGLLKLAGAVLDLATGLSFEPVPFDVGSAALPAAAHKPLGELAKLLSERPQVRLALCGDVTRADFNRLFPPPPPTPPAEQSSTGEGAAPAPDAAEPQTPPGPREPTDEQAKALWKLAAQRGQEVKAFLVKERGIEPKRLIVCNPERQLKEEGAPQVKISI